ncbi:ubiquitin ligase (cullin) of SCF [Coemansia sp. RSA 2671]|nr:ubiquitin ligase (cullin) of SCF [Coemansia sp. RSA 2675]KAJ2349102.1 ubiquitin ligase (cullin) of SCF [Coemansia sp. RSA 2671]
MAKSVRSKSKIKRRNLMRKAVFGPHEDERIQRLAARQQIDPATVAPPTAMMAEEEDVEVAGSDDEEDVDMDEDTKAASTASGRGISKNRKRRQLNKSGRIVVRNKKGRILSKTGVKWVKQIRPKNDLRQRLDGVLVGQQAMSIGDYMSISSAVSLHVQRAKAEMAAEEVRQWVAAYVNGHLAAVARRLQALERGAPLIAAYVAQWQYFAQASLALSGSLSRAVGSGMREAMAQAWYTKVFRPVAATVASAAVALVDAARKEGGVDDPQLLSALHSVLAELRPTYAPELPRGQPLGVYFAWYLEPYARASVRHIDSCTSHLRAPGSTREYIRLVTRLIGDEERRAEAYLRAESVESLRCVLSQRFVAGSLAAIHAEAALMFACMEDLRSVFCLLRRVPADRAAMQPLRDAFKAHVAQHTLAAMPSLAELNPQGASVASLAFARNAVDWLLAELGRHRAMAARCFDSEPGFSAALLAGLREALNSSQFMGPDHSQLVQAPRLLAGYFGLLLQADSALSLELAAAHPTGFEDAIESRARDALQLCELVNSKDKLMRHYRSLLARRLITDSSASAELERAVVAMLTPLTGIENTYHVRAMLADMSLSQNMSKQYQSSLSSESLDVSVKILRHSLWSDSLVPESSPELIVPRQASAACDRLAELYNDRHASSRSGRKLQWQWAYSKATIQLYFPHSVGRIAQTGYTVIANAYQLTILALFTDASCLGSAAQQLMPSQISRSIKLSLAVVNTELSVLMRAGILVSNSETGAVMMNSGFNSRRVRIDISGIKRMRQETAEDKARIDLHADSNRFDQVRSAIMVEMKRHSSLHHAKLLSLVAARVERVFLVERSVFKLAIGSLTEGDYIRRKEDDFNVYEYVV